MAGITQRNVGAIVALASDHSTVWPRGDLKAKHENEIKDFNPDLLRQVDAYWRAANYLSGGQIYLYDNPLLKRSLTLADRGHLQ